MLLNYNKNVSLTIRNAGSADAEQLAVWWNDGAIMEHAGFPNGLGTTAEKIASDLETDDDNRRRRLIIELDGIPIGEMGYSLNDKVARIGIKICDSSKREKGLGKIALSLLISSLFSDFGCEKITLDTNLTNTRAQHVYEQLGFKKLRVNMNSWKNQLGGLESTVDYELTAPIFVNYAK